jgi:N,N'-diacetyllegionaminate synthase
MTRRPLHIRERIIDDNNPCFVIAEIGNNHNGNVEEAKRLIHAAAESGADAVKFQTFKAEDIVSPNIPANAYPGFDVSDRFPRWIDFVKSFELPYDAYPTLIKEARSLGMAFLSTPASFEAISFLESLRIDALKIASMDLTNAPFLNRLAKTGNPLILSTGMSTYSEVETSTRLLGAASYAILHCVSVYPMPDDAANLKNITALRERFDVPIGFSSHSLGSDVDVSAVVLGARILEKHITLNRNSPQRAEHHMSIEPNDFRTTVNRIRAAERSLGTLERRLTAEEETNRRLARRSVAVKRDLPAGHRLQESDIALLRPGSGIEPKHYDAVIGEELRTPVAAFEPLQWENLRSGQGKTQPVHLATETIHQNGSDVIDCVSCGFWHVYPIPSKDELNKYYESIYFQNPQEHGDMKDKNLDPDGYYRLKYEDKLRNIEDLIQPTTPKVICDIGAGYGEYLEFMKGHGWTTYGVEPSPHCLESGRGASCGITLGDFDKLASLRLPQASVITINTVLEHVPYPEDLLVTVRDHMMTNDTLLHIEVPNDFSLLQECVNAACNPRKYWLCPIGHLNYWNFASFKNFVKRLGFQIERMEATFPLELLALTGDDYISDPSKGRGMHMKRVTMEKNFSAANNAHLKRQLFQDFASVGMGREIVAYLRKAP